LAKGVSVIKRHRLFGRAFLKQSINFTIFFGQPLI
jgi:hypothetical protein